DERRFPSKRFDDSLALLGGRYVAPELSGPDYPVGVVQDHQAMLLTAHSDCAHVVLAFAQLVKAALDSIVHGVRPCLWVLLQVAGRQPLDQAIGSLRGSEHFAGVNFHHDGLRALRAAVDTNVEHNLGAKTKGFEGWGRAHLSGLGWWVI